MSLIQPNMPAPGVPMQQDNIYPDWVTKEIKRLAATPEWVLEEINKITIEIEVRKTSANISYYVNAATGNDANDGLSAGKALKTIMAAVNKLPKFIDHQVFIEVSAGTYDEDVVIAGFAGKEFIYLRGGADKVAAAGFSLKSINISRNACYVRATGFKALGGLFARYNPGFAHYTDCAVNGATGAGYGILAQYSPNVYVQNSVFDNMPNAAIKSDINSQVLSSNNTGAGNAIALWTNAGKIMKAGTQPTGTSAELAESGGVIR